MNPNEPQNPLNDQPSAVPSPDPSNTVDTGASQPVADPVVTATPDQPTDSSFPAAAGGVMSTDPTPPKKSKKGLILGLVIGGGVLIAGLITLLLVMLMGGVSRQDYSAAQSQAKSAVSVYNTIAAVYVSGYDTNEQAAGKLDKLKTNLSTLDKNFTELGNAKAIKNDKKAADYYQKAKTEKADLDTFVNAEIEYLDKIHPLVNELSNVSYSDTTQTIAVLKEYEGKLKALDLKQKVNKDYIDEINTVLPQFISAIEAYVDAVNSGNYDSSLYTKVSKLSTDLTGADSTWKDNMEKLYDAVEFSGVMNDLGRYLTDKANGKSES